MLQKRYIWINGEIGTLKHTLQCDMRENHEVKSERKGISEGVRFPAGKDEQHGILRHFQKY